MPVFKSKLRTEWDYVRREYFPRWRNGEQWKVRPVADLNGSRGYCFKESKTIKVCVTEVPESEYRLLLIHEIAHAVTRHSHGAEWMDRMKLAAVRAVKIREAEMGKKLRQEVRAYIDSPKQTAAEVYQRIGECLMDYPAASRGEVLTHMSREFGISRQEFLDTFPRFNIEFAKAKREWNE
jgi:hypothetical protein